MKAYQADIAKFDAADTQILGVSVDSTDDNKKFAEEIGVTFPLLSDTSRKVSKDYGVLDEHFGFAKRVTFVVDKEGIIRNVDQGGAAIDPNGTYQACRILKEKKS